MDLPCTSLDALDYYRQGRQIIPPTTKSLDSEFDCWRQNKKTELYVHVILCVINYGAKDPWIAR